MYTKLSLCTFIVPTFLPDKISSRAFCSFGSYSWSQFKYFFKFFGGILCTPVFKLLQCLANSMVLNDSPPFLGCWDKQKINVENAPPFHIYFKTHVRGYSFQEVPLGTSSPPTSGFFSWETFYITLLKLMRDQLEAILPYFSINNSASVLPLVLY